MKINNLIIAFITLIIVGCTNNSKNKKAEDIQKKGAIKSTIIQTKSDELIVNDSAYILKTLVPFRYKELDEYYQDSIEKIEVTAFFGSWTISDISIVGGTFEKERTIRNQIGNKLVFSKDKLDFNFLDHKYEINNPEIDLETIDIEDGPETKGTTYFFGYRPERKQINSLVIKEVGYFEIIHYAEIAIYYDGRIYFLHKD